MNQETDEQLIVKYLAGDEAAFRLLLEKHLTAIYNFTAQFLGYGQDAEDAAQETFVKIWKSLGRFDPSKKFKPWLFRVARNTAIDFLRQRRATRLVDLNDDEEEDMTNFIVDPRPLPDDLVLSAELSRTVQDAIKTLPEIYRTVLNLYYLEELSLSEIAEVLREPAETVKSRHRRALIRLRKLWPGDGGPE